MYSKYTMLLFSPWVVSDSFETPWTCNPPGSSVHGISQARILERVAISFSRGSSRPRDRGCISCIDRWILYQCTTWEAQIHHKNCFSTLWFWAKTHSPIYSITFSLQRTSYEINLNCLPCLDELKPSRMLLISNDLLWYYVTKSYSEGCYLK